MVLGNRTVIDSAPGGNNNGRFDPGETGWLIIALKNIGNEPALNITATLRSSDNRFRILDSVADYGEIPACSTRLNTDDPFAVEVDSGIPLETSIPCSLFINGANFCDTISFRIIIGEIRAIDPIPDNADPPRYWAYDDIDTNYAHRPYFEWIECYGVGTQLILGDDQTVQVDLPAGFVWNYYGQSFSQISICSNGWVVPGYTTLQSYFNYGLPSTSAPANIVAVNWDDLDPRTGNGVWYYYEPMKRCFVVEWDSVPYYGSTTPEKFQLVIYDTTVRTPTGDNVIIMQYATANRFTSSTIGIQDYSQTIGIQCLYDTIIHRGMAPIAPGRAIKFITAGPDVGIQNPELGMRNLELAIKAYPNPFYHTVKLVLNKPLPTNSQVRIYDNTGRLVYTLSINPGTTSLTWDGKDNQTNWAKTGVYFLRIEGAKNQSITKLILVR